jgi:hypothetical protein
MADCHRPSLLWMRSTQSIGRSKCPTKGPCATCCGRTLKVRRAPFIPRVPHAGGVRCGRCRHGNHFVANQIALLAPLVPATSPAARLDPTSSTSAQQWIVLWRCTTTHVPRMLTTMLPRSISRRARVGREPERGWVPLWGRCSSAVQLPKLSRDCGTGTPARHGRIQGPF